MNNITKKIILTCFIFTLLFSFCSANEKNKISSQYKITEAEKKPFSIFSFFSLNPLPFSDTNSCAFNKIKKTTKNINNNTTPFFTFPLACLTEKNIPLLYKKTQQSFTGIVDIIRPEIQDFDQEYLSNLWSFSYSGNTVPLFKKIEDQKKYFFLKQLKEHIKVQNTIFTLPLKIDLKKNIQLSQKDLALLFFSDYSFYPARRNLKLLWPCTSSNYRIAIASINKKLVPAHKDFNINKRIAFRWWYCTSWEPIKRPFYAWVCGASSQAFRVSLLHPFLETHDRQGHGIWYTRYYWEEITWDDAAVIDFRMNLTLKNTSDYPIYFRNIENKIENSNLLVAISPHQRKKTITITKKQTWPLSAYLSKQIDSQYKTDYFQERNSTYRTKSEYITE